MLIAVVGPQYGGKRTIVDYLVERHAFQSVHVACKTHCSLTTSSSASRSASSGHLTWRPDSRAFSTASALLEWATIHWTLPIVIENPFNELEEQDGFRKRPFFLLISVMAPILLRHGRQNLVNQGASVQEPSDHQALGPLNNTIQHFVEEDDKQLFQRVHPNPESIKRRGLQSSGSAGVIATMSGLELNASRGADGPARSLQSHTSSVNGQPTTAEVAKPRPTVNELISTADLRIVNGFASKEEFLNHLDALQLPSKQRLRPSWDTYFLSLCTLASLRSNCMKRRVGAVLVRNNRVLSTGYNGTPRGLTNCNEGGCARCNGRLASAARGGASAMRPRQHGAPDGGQLTNGAPPEEEKTELIKSGVSLDECLCLHAEENALLECGREKGGAEGTVLYCNTCPCLRCAVKIVQTGVKEVVYELEYSMDDRSQEIFGEAGVIFRKYAPPI